MQGLLDWLQLDLVTLMICVGVTFCAGWVRGFSGFGFSALMVAGISLVVAPSEIVPTILMLEVLASLHMMPRV